MSRGAGRIYQWPQPCLPVIEFYVVDCLAGPIISLKNSVDFTFLGLEASLERQKDDYSDALCRLTYYTHIQSF